MTLSEVATELVQFGEDVNKIAQVVGDVFEAFPNEIATGLISAGVAIEQAFETVFDEIGKGVSGAINLIGNSIAGFGEDAVEAIADFFENDVKDFFEDVGGAVIDGITDVIDDVGDWFEDTCTVV